MILLADDDRDMQHLVTRILTDAMEHVTTEVSRAAGIVTHLREFVRGQEPHRSSVDIGRLLKQAVALLEPMARDKKVNLKLEEAEDIVMIQADAVQIEQVVVNLVTNAIEAVSELPARRRAVTVATRLSEARDPEIVVRDHGPGIAKNISNKLFETFVTTKEKGLGLGLAISRSIVESHGGKLWVVDNKPHGTAFHVALPFSPAGKE